ncbi:SAF domain-containing protein [Pseudonocardia eucalypti]|uniref:SAF domain-containing protein n=1 Tax=Pseudonocardia eucalypti TaxID=648755 RepID=A0ABP9PSH7_9PSEU|nr:Flp pilus assembly protein CpaB [Pseudonocardia eucalypti]
MTDKRWHPPWREPLASAAADWSALVDRVTLRLGWRRVVWLRRALAGALVLTAGLLAVRGPAEPERVPVLVAGRDLGPGVTLRAEDVRLVHWPPELAPSGSLREPAEAAGQVLAGAANRGEPLTSVRLAGPELIRRAGDGADAASVPIRLADSDLAALLRPGRLVDVVTIGPRADSPNVLAAGATVLAVLPADDKTAGRGRLVLVAVPRAAATRLAAATLSQEVTITLR